MSRIYMKLWFGYMKNLYLESWKPYLNLSVYWIWARCQVTFIIDNLI